MHLLAQLTRTLRRTTYQKQAEVDFVAETVMKDVTLLRDCPAQAVSGYNQRLRRFVECWGFSFSG
eukprot:4667781-Amphidinium_carterae.1